MKEYKILRQATSDAEAKTKLYLLKHGSSFKIARTCPRCGETCQREAGSVGDNVTCLRCGASVRCRQADEKDAAYRMYDEEIVGSAISTTCRHQLFRVITAAANAADELENDRTRLGQLVGFDATALSDTFSYVAQGRKTFTLPDLRRSVHFLGIKVSQKELDLLWKRYAPDDVASVAFPDFVRQLKPLSPMRAS
eukprot:TRINITY_DN35531_c0_g1_i1.p1 TRINITY_DN35531_c0_g1~~TRINITY_DN35531_c0_g1_i1.p1  ORF type:complete len:195 (-),score=33.24 TRINITY_DN35531_c0_g1_i1:59-643(-)